MTGCRGWGYRGSFSLLVGRVMVGRWSWSWAAAGLLVGRPLFDSAFAGWFWDEVVLGLVPTCWWQG